MFRTPRIDALDLSKPKPKFNWNWPKAPAFSYRRQVKVYFTADTRKASDALTKILNQIRFMETKLSK